MYNNLHLTNISREIKKENPLLIMKILIELKYELQLVFWKKTHKHLIITFTIEKVVFFFSLTILIEQTGNFH